MSTPEPYDEDDGRMDTGEALDVMTSEHTLLAAFLSDRYPHALVEYFAERGWITVH